MSPWGALLKHHTDPGTPVDDYSDFIVGANGQYLWYDYVTTAVERTILNHFGSNGGQRIRKDAHWKANEPNPPTNGKFGAAGNHNYIQSGEGNYDLYVGEFAKAGLTWHPQISDAPKWAARYTGTFDDTGHSCVSDAHIQDQVEFCKWLIKRYGPMMGSGVNTVTRTGGDVTTGVYWRLHPELPYCPILSVEIGNEVNAYNGGWWGTLLSAAAWKASSLGAKEYGIIFAPCYAAMKAIFPGLEVLVAGITGGPSSTGNAEWIQRLFAQIPDFICDGFCLHPYAKIRTNDEATANGYGINIHWGYNEVRLVRDAIDATSQAGKPIWITEIGLVAYEGPGTTYTNFSQNGFSPPDPPVNTRALQVAWKSDHLTNWMQDAPRSDCNIKAIFPHTIVTAESSTTDPEHWFGLYVRTSGILRAAGTAFTTAAKRMKGMLVTPPLTGTVHFGSDPAPPPATPNKVSVWGNSLSEGFPYTSFNQLVNGVRVQSWPNQMDIIWPGGTVQNLGINSQSTDEIMLRQGGRKLTVTFPSGSIPASGTVAVTVTEFMNWRLDRNWSMAGTINGVAGTLTRTATGTAPPTFTFTRTTPGSAIPFAGGHLFTSSQDTAYSQNVGVIWVGGNDFGYQPAGYSAPHVRIPPSVTYMVNHAGAFADRQLILSCETTHTMPSGSAAYAEVMATNDALQAAYPDQYFDLRAYMVHQLIYDAGITPTADDLDAIAHDTLPRSIMSGYNGTTSDDGHYAPLAAPFIAQQIYLQLTGKGFIV